MYTQELWPNQIINFYCFIKILLMDLKKKKSARWWEIKSSWFGAFVMTQAKL